MDFSFWHLSVCLLLALVPAMQFRKQNICRPTDLVQKRTICNVELNTTICLVCPVLHTSKSYSSFSWWYNYTRVYRDNHSVEDTPHQLNCYPDLYSLFVPQVVLPEIDILYYCEDSNNNRFEFNIKAYVYPSLVIQANNFQVQEILKVHRDQRMTFQCVLRGAIPPLNMTWLINGYQNKSTSFLDETNQPQDYNISITFTIAKGIKNISCKSSGPYIAESVKTTSIEGTADEPVNSYGLLGLYIAVPCLFVTSLVLTFCLYFHVKHGRQQIKRASTEGETGNISDPDEYASVPNACVYSDITQESEITTCLVTSSCHVKTSLITRLKTSGKFDYWSATCIKESSEEENCFAKTLSSFATVKDAKTFQELAMNLQSIKKSAFVVQLLCVSVEEIPYTIYYEYMECGSLRDFMLRRYQQARNSRMSIGNPDILPSNVKSHIQELLGFSSMITDALKFISSQKFSHPALSLKKVLLSSYCECKLYDIYPTEMAMTRINDLMKKDYPPIAWMAPETIFLNEYQTSSDVWSFAVLLWELFSLGDTPFATDTKEKVEQKMRQGIVLSQPLCCPGAMYGIMLSCWNNASSKRPTFEAMLSKMKNMLEKLKQETKLPRQSEVPHSSYFVLGAESTYI